MLLPITVPVSHHLNSSAKVGDFNPATFSLCTVDKDTNGQTLCNLLIVSSYLQLISKNNKSQLNSAHSNGTHHHLLLYVVSIAVLLQSPTPTADTALTCTRYEVSACRPSR